MVTLRLTRVGASVRFGYAHKLSPERMLTNLGSEPKRVQSSNSPASQHFHVAAYYCDAYVSRGHRLSCNNVMRNV